MNNQMTAPNLSAEVKVQPSQKSFNYRTKLRFTDINRPHETIISVQPPAITQAGMLQLLLNDRLVTFPLQNIFRFEVEQLDEIVPSKIIVSEK